MTSEQMAKMMQAKATVERLRQALRAADSAINPADRSGISLDEWNKRLKSATLDIRDAVRRADEFLA
jgi:hypothetical protein